MSKFNKLDGAILFVVLVPLVFLGIYLWPAPQIYNNTRISAYLNELKQIELPEDSIVLDSYSKFGLLWGNSNHCDTEVGLLVESELSWENFLNSFNDLNGEQRDPVWMYEYMEGELYSLDFEGRSLFEPDFSELKRDHEFFMKLVESNEVQTESYYYILFRRDQTFEGYSMNDMRCH